MPAPFGVTKLHNSALRLTTILPCRCPAAMVSQSTPRMSSPRTPSASSRSRSAAVSSPVSLLASVVVMLVSLQRQSIVALAASRCTDRSRRFPLQRHAGEQAPLRRQRDGALGEAPRTTSPSSHTCPASAPPPCPSPSCASRQALALPAHGESGAVSGRGVHAYHDAIEAADFRHRPPLRWEVRPVTCR